ncbi:MAG TPA: sn-glycerol-3-phosphate ABC transporter ATP-binding protein UgpC [Gemmatimonadales bacterium]|nr:sn-glycerol-3-phosphate ABC transporter ATP-binding protein UgpC [Gemmatimonadales bacterium]
MASVRLAGVEKTYPNGHVAARGIELEIADGEFMVLVGPSGCGKSTALRMIAGLETPTAGRVLIGERDVTALPPQERDIAMVFQSYALYPHMTVRENLSFGLRMRGVARPVIGERVENAARALGLEAVLERKPGQLSGGQRQRVALGRAMVRDPKVFLFDEPLSNLDAKLRVETRAELARLHRRLKATIVYVTHDQEEALTLGGRVAVMRDGNVEQVAPPMEVYRRPASVFVAGFVGSPAMNLLPGDVRPDGTWTGPGGLVLPLAGPRGGADVPARMTLGVRPHDVAIILPGAGDATARVDVVEPRGSELLVHLRLGADGEGGELRVVAPPEQAIAVDTAVGVRLDRDRLHWFDEPTGRRLE